MGENWKKKMSDVLRIIPLGGLGEVGKNMTLFEYGHNILVVDAGIMFPEHDMLGIDVVIPDFTYLRDKADWVRAIVITHGHEDHIGALPYLLGDVLPVETPIYATRLAGGLIGAKLAEYPKLPSPNVKVIAAGEGFRRVRSRWNSWRSTTPSRTASAWRSTRRSGASFTPAISSSTTRRCAGADRTSRGWARWARKASWRC